MGPNEILVELEIIASFTDFSDKSNALVLRWQRNRDSFIAVEPILKFMELHPEIDYGTPGPLVHFLERFYKKGYEQKLFESIIRKPITHTLWMLSRIINVEKDMNERKKMLEILKRSIDHPLADDNVRNLALHFVRIHSSNLKKLM